MSLHIDLPGGASAEFRDPQSLTEGQRRPVRRKMLELSDTAKSAAVATNGDIKAATEMAKTMTADDLDIMQDVADLVTVALVTSWTFGVEPPTVADLLNLPGPAYDALTSAAMAHMGAFVGVDFTPTPPGVESPTGPSGA